MAKISQMYCFLHHFGFDVIWDSMQSTMSDKSNLQKNSNKKLKS